MKIYSLVWKIQAKKTKNGNFGQKMAKFWPKTPKFWPYQNMIFSKKTTGIVSISKIMKIYSDVWKIQTKKTKKWQFRPKNGQILAQNGQIFAISEFSRHIEYDFLKEHHKTCFHIKNYENLQRLLEDIGQKAKKNGNFCQKWPNFDHFWPKSDQF